MILLAVVVVVALSMLLVMTVTSIMALHTATDSSFLVASLSTLLVLVGVVSQ